MRNNKYAFPVLAISLSTMIAFVSGCVPRSDQPTVTLAVVPDRPEEKLPKDHPIFTAPNLLDDDERRRTVPSITTTYSGKAPVWTFALDKTRFWVGETITGKIAIENVDKEKSFRFSPPYRGFLVATTGVWIARRDDIKAGWGKLEPLFPINRGRLSNAEQLQGEQVLLAPGAKCQAALPINGLAYFTGDGSKRTKLPRWLGGVGFSEPGQYRFYLQYVNLELPIPFQYRWPFDGEGPKAGPLKYFPESLLLDLGPVVLGPYEVEVVALEGGETDALTECFQGWTKQYQSPRFDYRVHRIANTKELPDLIKLKSLQSESLSPVRDSLALTQFQSELVKLPRDADERGRALSALVVEVRDARKKLPRGPLYDAYGLTECYLRHLQGKTNEALALARELDTPDSKVFIADFTPKPATPKGAE